MDDIDEAIKRVKSNPEDIEAWENLRDKSEDPQKKQDCQDQIDRLLKEQLALICPQCGAGMEVVYKGKFHDKVARCDHCGAQRDLHDGYTRVEVKEGDNARVAVLERRSDGIEQANIDVEAIRKAAYEEEAKYYARHRFNLSNVEADVLIGRYFVSILIIVTALATIIWAIVVLLQQEHW